MALKFCCGALCFLIFLLSPELRADDTIYITAYHRLSEFVVDEIAYAINDTTWYPNTTLQGSISQETRLIAFRAQNDGILSCGGVLASTVSNSIITDSRFKCVNSNYSGWWTLGYNDSNWTQAIEYEDNTAGRINCYQNDPVPNINPNAKWIWFVRETYPIVYCRGYTNFCDASSPCLNGGTCLKNSLDMCLCTPQFTGKYCETRIDPCTHYQFIDIADGFRSSDFKSSCRSTISICDSNLKNSTWYRVQHDAGNRLLEGPIDPWFCGTQAPIYLNGTKYINQIEAIAGACAVYSDTNMCGWYGQVLIRNCTQFGESFLVYLLPVPPACPMAYCVDASSRRQCVPPEVWISDKFRCGEHTPTSAPCEEPPSGSGWSEWGPWSECTKTCDYGLQSRRRVCGQIPCAGLSTELQACNTFDCPTIEEQKKQGVATSLKASDQTEDSLLSVIQNEGIIYEQLRISLNAICSKNGFLCCGTNYRPPGSDTKEYVTLGNVYRAQGGLTPNSDGTISLHVIAEANGTLCSVESQGIANSSAKHFIPYETMHMAANLSAPRIYENTDLIILNIDDPSTIYITVGGGEDGCSIEGCVIPIVVCLVGSAAIIVAAVIGYRAYETTTSRS